MRILKVEPIATSTLQCDIQTTTDNFFVYPDGDHGILVHNSPSVVAASDFYGDTFVATKGFFAKDRKIARTPEDCHKYFGHAPDLERKMVKLLTQLPAIAIPKNQIWQGDFLFDSESLIKEIIDGEPHVAFHPNTIVYAVPISDPLAKKILAADVGVAWHARYRGSDVNNLKISFDANADELRQVTDVFSVDARLPPLKGLLTAEQQREADTLLMEISENVDELDRTGVLTLVAENEELKLYLDTFQNSLIKSRGQQFSEDIPSYLKELIAWVKDRYDKEIASKKQDKTKLAYTNRRDQALQLLADNLGSLNKLISTQMAIVTIKELFISVLNESADFKTLLKTLDKGYIPTGPEGYAISDVEGNVVKLVSRLEFSKANFSKEVVKGWMSDARMSESNYDKVAAAYGKATTTLPGEKVNILHTSITPPEDNKVSSGVDILAGGLEDDSDAVLKRYDSIGNVYEAIDDHLSTEDPDFLRIFAKYWYGNGKLPSVEGYPAGLDLENREVIDVTPTTVQIKAGGDWQNPASFSFAVTKKGKKPVIVDRFDSAPSSPRKSVISSYMQKVKGFSPSKESTMKEKEYPDMERAVDTIVEPIGITRRKKLTKAAGKKDTFHTEVEAPIGIPRKKAAKQLVDAAPEVVVSADIPVGNTRPVVSIAVEDYQIDLNFKDNAKSPNKLDAKQTKIMEEIWAEFMYLCNQKKGYPTYEEVAMKFDLATPDWYDSFISGAEAVNNFLDADDYIFSREGMTFPPQDLSIHEILNRSFTSSRSIFKVVGSKKDSWNPSDVYACRASSYHEVIAGWKNIVASNDSTLADVNGFLVQLMLDKTLVGISLKSLTNPSKAEVEVSNMPSETVELDTHEYRLDRLLIDFGLPSQMKVARSMRFSIQTVGSEDRHSYIDGAVRFFGGSDVQSRYAGSQQMELHPRGGKAQLGKVPTGIMSAIAADFEVNLPGKKEIITTYLKDLKTLVPVVAEIEGALFGLTNITSSGFRQLLQMIDTSRGRDQEDLIYISQLPAQLFVALIFARAMKQERMPELLTDIVNGAKKLGKNNAPFVKIS